MTQTVRQLKINVTVTATWTQIQEGVSNYAVPAGGRAEVAHLLVENLDSDSVVVEVAISPTNTITNDEIILPPVTLTENEWMETAIRHVLAATDSLWLRATGTTPNATLRGSVLEVT